MLVASVSFLPTFLYMPISAVLPENSEVDGFSKLFLLMKSFFEVGFFEIAQLGALDRALLLTIIVAVVTSFKNPAEIASKYYLAVLIAVWSIGAINGTVGVNFRYQLPVLAFACWTILSNSTNFTDRFSGRRVDVERKEAKN